MCCESGESDEGGPLCGGAGIAQSARDELLQALDRRLSQEALATGEGKHGNGSDSLAELEAVANSLPQGTWAGWHPVRALPSDLPELIFMLKEAFRSGTSPSLPPSLLQGRFSLL